MDTLTVTTGLDVTYIRIHISNTHAITHITTVCRQMLTPMEWVICFIYPKRPLQKNNCLRNLLLHFISLHSREVSLVQGIFLELPDSRELTDHAVKQVSCQCQQWKVRQVVKWNFHG